MRYAHVIANSVFEIVIVPDGMTIDEMFHPAIAATMIAAGDDVEIGWNYDEGTFTAPLAMVSSLDDLKMARIADLRLDCQNAIVGGYQSSALGEPHLYPSAITDQINMMGSVTDSLLPDLPNDWSTPFWCANASGAWDFRMHSAAQIQTAGSSGKAFIIACQASLSQLSAAVSAASTAEEVAAITWSIA